MTALAGVWAMSGTMNTGQACRQMLAAQRIYGPDGDAVWDGGDVAIGRSIFEVLPEDAYDRGPRVCEQSRYRLVGDVRLDNREELADALGIDAGVAARLPDAAFLLHAWEKWEESAFDWLYGDYAFALWDDARQRLILARDFLGYRPLHYHLGDGYVAFASMPKGLHALPEIPYAPDQIRVAEQLAMLPEAGPRSFFEGIMRVESGHYAVIDSAGVRQHRHWKPTPESVGVWQGDDPVAALREELDRAVRVRLRGAGNSVATHLSAGLDSSAVTATAAREMARSGGSVVAFTAVPRHGYAGPVPAGRIGDEGVLAALTAAYHPNIEHVRIAGAQGSLSERWDKAFYLLDRPLLNPSNDLWNHAIDAAANRRGLRVLLTGEMGNITISYDGIQLLPELVRKRAWARLWREGRALVGKRQARWRGVLASAFGPWMPSRMWRALNRWQRQTDFAIETYTAIRTDRMAALDLEARARERGTDLSYRPRRNAFESRLWWLGRVDRGNFHHAALAGERIDQRDPTSDRRLIEFCLSLPTEFFLNAGIKRALGLQALADRLPAAVLEQRHRGYQAADWHESITAQRAELVADLQRLEDLPAASELLDLPRLQALLAALPEEGWEQRTVVERYRFQLLRGAATGHFLRKASRTNL